MESPTETAARDWTMPLARWFPHIREREEQVFLALTLVIGVLTGLVVVAFIIVTERLGMHLYPVGSAPWRRVLIPVLGSLAMGYLLYRYFPHARGSGVPQTKAALFARGGHYDPHRSWKILLYRDHACLRNSPRTRRPFRTSRRRNRFHPRPSRANGCGLPKATAIESPAWASAATSSCSRDWP